jgi:hypothetical protein
MPQAAASPTHSRREWLSFRGAVAEEGVRGGVGVDGERGGNCASPPAIRAAALSRLRDLAEREPDEDVHARATEAIQKIDQALASESSPPSAAQQ